MADLPSRTAGETGHVADHNAIAAWLNAQGYDEGQDILGHTGFPGGSTNFLRADGAWAAPPSGGGTSAGFTTAMGWQFVRASGGSDSNDGVSPATAKATIAAAHSALPTTGGTIWLSEGTHVISSQVNISKRGVALIGAGRTATRLKCGTAGIHMVHWTGHDGFCANFVVTDGSDTSFGSPMLGRGLSGIWLDDAQEMVMLNVRFDSFGMGAAAGLSFDAGPAALRAVCTTGFGDWMTFYQLIFRNCYRGSALSTGNNGNFNSCAWYSGGQERVFIEKRAPSTGGSGATFHFSDCHFTGPGSTWAVKIDHGAGASTPYRVGTTFTSCRMELSAATGNFGGWYVNGSEVLFDDITTSGGTAPYVRCGPDAAGVRWGRHSGPDPVLQVSSQATGAMRAWVTSDDSGTVASGRIDTV